MASGRASPLASHRSVRAFGAQADLRDAGHRVKIDRYIIAAAIVPIATGPRDEEALAIGCHRRFRRAHAFLQRRKKYLPMAARMTSSIPG